MRQSLLLSCLPFGSVGPLGKFWTKKKKKPLVQGYTHSLVGPGLTYGEEKQLPGSHRNSLQWGLVSPTQHPIDPTAAVLPVSCRLPRESVNRSQAWPVPVNDGGISFTFGQPGRIPVPTHLYDFVALGRG